MAIGKLVVEINYAQEALPVDGINVRVYTNNLSYDRTFVTNDVGKTPEISLVAPSAQLSLNENNTIIPYATYNVETLKNGVLLNRIRGIQVFADTLAIQQIELNPIQSIDVEGNDIVIPTHALFNGTGGSGPATEIPDDPMQFVLAYPIIPSRMRVHLGRPGTNSRIVTVSFIDYIKNVASSEIYPTWPNNSLRANIYCQISLALNRVYTEWYPSKGYNFDITNSTAFDQAYVHGRNIYDSVSKITDELFMQYVRKISTINPYYTEYCDGKQVSCPGLKQWGTVTYAEQGLNPLEILRKYYTNIEIVSTDRIEENVGSFPGYNLRVGMRDNNVAIIQNQLNRITVNYPAIKPVIPVDGNFTTELESSIKTFQRTFNLTADGVVGRATWYKVSYIYVAVKKLAELTSEGEQAPPSGQYPGTVLREGSSGIAVQEAQYYLDTIADFTPLVNSIAVDGIFGRATTAATVAFQKMARLTPDGLIGRNTWNALVRGYKDTQLVNVPPVPPVVPYPGTPLRLGSRGDNVKSIQYYLNRIYLGSSTVQQIAVDGIFGVATQNLVITFQREYGLTADGIVGKLTWDKIIQIYNNIVTYALTVESNYQVYDFTTENSIDLIYNR